MRVTPLQYVIHTCTHTPNPRTPTHHTHTLPHHSEVESASPCPVCTYRKNGASNTYVWRNLCSQVHTSNACEWNLTSQEVEHKFATHSDSYIAEIHQWCLLVGITVHKWPGSWHMGLYTLVFSLSGIQHFGLTNGCFRVTCKAGRLPSPLSPP